jgi:hypothetical protein
MLYQQMGLMQLKVKIINSGIKENEKTYRSTGFSAWSKC